MSKPFPDLKTDEEAEDWLQNADLTEYDLSDMKKVRFELAPKDATISLRRRAPCDAEDAGGRGEHADATVHPGADRGAVGGPHGEAEGVALARTGGIGGPTAAQSARLAGYRIGPATR
jgi:CopG antitoxin of type II toxin-antitoxin system